MTGEYECLCCEKPVPNFKPIMCCGGHECGCMGQPIEPPTCSAECEKVIMGGLFGSAGTFAERRKLSGIKLWWYGGKYQ